VNISVVIATYGSEEWARLGQERAHPSALDQGAHEIVIGHDIEGTVSSVRNSLAEKTSGDWLCFLDGDDELGPGYVEAMRRACEREGRAGTPLLLTPAVSYVRGPRKRTPARIWPQVPFEQGNWLVIGTLLPRDLFFSVGGFRDYGNPPGENAYEDWSLWARCYQAGVQVVQVPSAVYFAYWETSSRHRNADAQTRLRWHHEIGRDLFPEHYDEGWIDRHLPRQPRSMRRTRVR
jgi:glycosyltransferase involved in cell wall biosynthesis